MKKQRFAFLLPLIALCLGIVCLGLRWLLFLTATDWRGLLTPGQPLEAAVWGVTIGALVLLAAVIWRRRNEKGTVEAFPPSLIAAIGHILAAAGVLASALPGEPLLPGGLGLCWRVLGIAACPCLLAAGYCRLVGKKPFFLLHTVPCLFYLFHIVNHYRIWSGQTQLQDYLFSLLAAVALMLFALYTAAVDTGLPRQRAQVAAGLAAIYFSIASLAAGDFRWLYIGGAAWGVAELMTLPPLTPLKKDDKGENA